MHYKLHTAFFFEMSWSPVKSKARYNAFALSGRVFKIGVKSASVFVAF